MLVQKFPKASREKHLLRGFSVPLCFLSNNPMHVPPIQSLNNTVT